MWQACTTTSLSKVLTSCLTAIKNHWIKYCEKSFEREGINYIWSIKTLKINGMILILILLISRSLMVMSLNVPLMVYIYLNLFALLEHLRMLLTNKFLTAKLLKQGYRYHKLRKAIPKFYRRHFELIEKYHVSLKKLMQGIL